MPVTSDDVLPTSLAPFPFSTPAHDRLAYKRPDAAFLAAAWADQSTRVLEVRGSELATNAARDSLRWVSPRQAPPGARMLLGRANTVVHFAVLVDPALPTAGETWEEYDELRVSSKPAADSLTSHHAPLRTIATKLDAVEASLAVHAASLTGWHLRHPKCSVCGAETAPVESGASRRCPSCGTVHFPRTDPAVIMLAIDEEDRCLLGHNAARAAGWFSTLAGFVEPGESPEAAVVRELKEETDIDVDEVRYAGAQPWPFPASLMLGFFARATGTEITVDGDEITAARWFSRAELKAVVERGEVGLPTPISIAYALVAAWYGEELPRTVLTTPR
ncbi:MAG: NAD(+) diphosphatase [Nocardioidaceae bacterium]